MSNSTTPAATLPVFPALDNTLGPYFVATYVGLILYGITLQQSFRYYRLYPSDSRLLKGLIIAVLISETFHTILCMHTCYFYASLKFSSPLLIAVSPGPRSLQTIPLSASIVIVITHSFFIRRAYLIGPRWKWLLLVAVVLVIAELGFSAAASAKAYMLVTFADFSKVIWLIATACGMTAVSDIFLCVVFIDALNRSRTGFRRTNTIINTLIVYAIGTGVVTSFFILLSFIFSVVYPTKEIYAGLNMGSSKLYANMLLVALNSRTELSGAPAGDSDGSGNTWRFGTSIPTAILNAAPDEQPIELRDFDQSGATKRSQTASATARSVLHLKPSESYAKDREFDLESRASSAAQ